MSKKFTEDQYQKIVKAWQSENTYVHQTEAVIDYLIDDLNVDVTLMGDEAIALANPLTRDLIKKDLVEEEERFLFTKIKKVEGDILSLNQLDGDVHIYLDGDDPTPLTIKQVEEYGYNLDAFTKTPYEHGVSEEDDDLPF